MPLLTDPIPDWLPDLAEGTARQRFNSDGQAEPTPSKDLFKLKNRILESSSADYCTHWAKWFFADRATRTISPSSPVSVPEYVQRRIHENTVDSLQAAIRLSPTNGLAFARLALLTLKEGPASQPPRNAEADFYSQRAIQLSPKDGEVLKIRSEISQKLGKLTPP